MPALCSKRCTREPAVGSDRNDRFEPKFLRAPTMMEVAVRHVSSLMGKKSYIFNNANIAKSISAMAVIFSSVRISCW